MLSRIVLSFVVAVAVYLGCTFLGMLLVSAGGELSVVTATGAFLKVSAWLIGLLCGLWFFFTNRTTLL